MSSTMPSALKRHKFVVIPALLISTLGLYYIFLHQYQIRNILSYATRPLWDVADGPKHVIPHYYAEGMRMDQHACKLHGWKPRAEPDVQVIDAVLMSSELDLLEIRMNELDAVVDNFLIIESNATFTGLPKETFFADNRERFKRFNNKLVYHFLPGFPLAEGQSAWNVEGNTRNAMTVLLRDHLKERQATMVNALVIMSDVDEIPSSHTIALLKACDFGQSIHLQLRNFLYSFEWFVAFNSWRASVHVWHPRKTFYRHSKSSDVALADSGWHCSYCFRTIREYVIKMQGFSHYDRIGDDTSLLDPKRIQETICKGKDIFGMLPEVYNYKDLVSQMNLDPVTSAVGLPRFLIENAENFRFLLPGGCLRET